MVAQGSLAAGERRWVESILFRPIMIANGTSVCTAQAAKGRWIQQQSRAVRYLRPSRSHHLVHILLHPRLPILASRLTHPERLLPTDDHLLHLPYSIHPYLAGRLLHNIFEKQGYCPQKTEPFKLYSSAGGATRNLHAKEILGPALLDGTGS